MMKFLKKFLPPSQADLEKSVREEFKAMLPDPLLRAKARRSYYRRSSRLDNRGLLIKSADLANVYFALSRVHERLGTLSHEQYEPLHGIAGDLKIVKDALDTGLKVEDDDQYGCWREI
jgi:hypothetical protein